MLTLVQVKLTNMSGIPDLLLFFSHSHFLSSLSNKVDEGMGWVPSGQKGASSSVDVRADLQPVEKTHAQCTLPTSSERWGGGEGGGGDRGQLSQHIVVVADRMPPVLLRWQCLTDSSGFNFINAFLFF